MTEPMSHGRDDRRVAVDHLSDDTLGFGALELRTAKAVLIRPREVLEAWMAGGSSGHGRYARPLRLYLALNAILMLVLFLKGGSTLLMMGVQEAQIADLIAASGKSRDGFLADADGWMTLVMVPFLSLGYACAAAPLLRWWDPEDLGWRRGFRAAFAYLCAWTVPLLPLAWWSFDRGPIGQLAAVALFALGIVTFMRMGAGRWWRSPVVGLGKAILLAAALQLGGLVGYIPVLAVGLAAGRFA